MLGVVTVGWGILIGTLGQVIYWFFVSAPSSVGMVWRTMLITWPLFSLIVYLFRVGPNLARLGLASFPELKPWDWANRVVAEKPA